MIKIKNLSLLSAIILSVFSLFLNVSCATSPPVQEMSNARQAINAARDAKADQYASELYIKAQDLLEDARSSLEDGDYYSARYLALEAKQEAIQARHDAQINNKTK